MGLLINNTFRSFVLGCNFVPALGGLSRAYIHHFLHTRLHLGHSADVHYRWVMPNKGFGSLESWWHR